MPKTLDDLKVNIEREIRNIKQDVLKSTFLNFRKRLNLIIETKGGHIEQIKISLAPSQNHISQVYFKVSFIKKRSFL
jgi:hypothetical protein